MSSGNGLASCEPGTERHFMSTFKEWKGFGVTAHGMGDDVTFYETVMDWVATT